MRLEFKDIFSKDLKNDVKTIEKTLDKSFRKSENKTEKFSKSMISYFMLSCTTFIFSFFLGVMTKSNFFGFTLLVSFVILIGSIFCSIICEEKVEKEKKKVKQITNDKIFKYYQRKKKNINSKKINNNLKSLTLKQQEILMLIQKNELYKESFEKIQKSLITEKLQNTSQSEFDLHREEIENYIDSIEKLKVKNKFNEIIDKYFETKPQIIKELEKKVVNV